MTKPRDIGEIHEAVNDAIDRHMEYIVPQPMSAKSNEFIMLLKMQIIAFMLEELYAWQEELGND